MSEFRLKRAGRPSEIEVTFYERHPPRIVALLRDGLKVRSPRLLEPDWKAKHCKPPMPNTWGYVYVFAAGAHVKIGISECDVEKRWSSMRTDNPLLERPLYISPPLEKRCRVVEKKAHEALMEYHFSGEWFSCNRQLAINTVRSLIDE